MTQINRQSETVDGYNPIMVQTRGQIEYGYGIDEQRVYIGA